MNFWIWVAIWVAILAATGLFYYQIFTTLKSKAQRVLGQLEILMKNLEKLQKELETPAEFEPAPSAIETGERSAIWERERVIGTRIKAKEARQRRLIKGLKKLQQESE